jgi:nicotinamidase-related amidase
MDLRAAGAALLAIDMQRGFDLPAMPRRWNRAADENGRSLLAAWRGAGLPVLHVRHDSVEPGSPLRPGQPGHAFRDGFAPAGDEPVVAKTVNSAFIGTDLDLRLRRLGIDTVVAFGLTTDMCVSTTVRVGSNLGYTMVLIEDACDCFELPDGRGATIPAETVHAVSVATLRFEFATVLTTREALARTSAAAPAA